MIQYACHCNWNIPGVETLPAHDHNQERRAADLLAMNGADPRVDRIIAEHLPLRDGVHVWVDWKAVSRG